MTFGERVKLARERKGLSQNEENQMLSYLNTLHDMNKTEKID